MKTQDDRTPEQIKSHTVLVAMTDKFLSGWGKAERGKSYAAWACRPKDADRVLRWVESRSDALRVRVVGNSWNPRGNGHTHIYVVNENHPALVGM